MSARPAHTLIAVRRASLVRADIARAGEVVALARAASAPSATLASEIERAASLGGPLGTSVWILWEDAARVVATLPAAAVEGLDDRELARALAFELQLSSGIAAGDGEVAWRATEAASAAERAFDVVQIARSDLSSAIDVVARRGARLAGIAHPAGVPRSLVPARAGAWRRVEAWPGLTVEVSGEGARASDVRVRASGTSRRGDQSSAAVELLAAGGSPPRGLEVVRAVDVDEAEGLAEWTAAWALCLAERDADVAWIAPQRAELSRRARAAWAALAAGVALASCALHSARLAGERDALAREVAAARAPGEALEALRAKTAALEQRASELDERERLARATASSPRWDPAAPARLLDVLALDRPSGTAIDALEIGPRGGFVRGVCADAASVDVLGRALDTTLAPLGQALVSTQKRASGPIVEFTLRVAPRGTGTLSRDEVDR